MTNVWSWRSRAASLLLVISTLPAAAQTQATPEDLMPADDAERAWAAAGDYSAWGRRLNAQAGQAFAQGQRARAAELWHRAYAAFERSGERGRQGNVLYSLTFVERDDSAAVARTLEHALSLAREAGDAQLEGQIQQRWGDEEFLNGRYAPAIERVQIAVGLLERQGTPDRLARALTSLGRVYRVHGQYDRSLAIYTRALALHEATNDVPGIAQSMNAVATALRRLGRFDQGLAMAERAVRTIGPADKTGALALALNTVGNFLGELDRAGEALAAVEHALAASPQPRDVPLMQAARGLYLSRLGRHDAAVTAVTGALALPEAPRAGVAHAELVGLLALVRAAGAGATAGMPDSEHAVALIDEVRALAVPQDGLRAGFDEAAQWIYAQHVSLLVETGRGAEALEAAERARARAFADLLATRRLAETSPATPRVPVRGRTSAPEETGAAAIAVEASAAPASLDDVRAHAVRLHSTIVAFWVHRDVTSVWTVSPSGEVHAVRVAVSSRRLTTLVADAATTAGSPRVFRELYDLLIAPIAASLPRTGNRRLTLIPHGPLFRLSFAALKSPSGRYLVEDFALHYAPSAAVLTATAAQHRPDEARAGFLVVADPTLAPSYGVASDLQPLPGALEEGRLVAAAGRAEPASVLVRDAATEARVRALAGQRRVLHFATHAVVSDEHPLDSFLALSGAGDEAAADGRLTAEEVYGLRLEADLVVLSGCRTAGGSITGDGITGLARAFFYAGTPALVASLWELPDAAGRVILPRFYQRWEHSGDKAAALRDGQLALLRALRAGSVSVTTPAGPFVLTEHPALWAGLVLIGEP